MRRREGGHRGRDRELAMLSASLRQGGSSGMRLLALRPFSPNRRGT